jgi:hypothetical protein
MRPPATLGDLLPVLVPGTVLLGAAALLAMATPVGPMIFAADAVFLLLSVVAGALVAGYLVAGLQEHLAATRPAWALPPMAHLAPTDVAEHVPATAAQRAGFEADGTTVEVPLAAAYALERALAGAWGIPEGAGWGRVQHLQRMALALGASAALAAAFFLGGLLAGEISRGLRAHGTPVLVLGLVGALLCWRRARAARREGVVDLLADARALVMDRGEHPEVRRVLDEVGLDLREPEVDVRR